MAAPLEHMRVPANRINLHVVAAGPEDAQPIVFLHGFPEGWMSWRKVMLRLADRYRVVAPDLRGYGGTDKPEHGYDLHTLSDDIREMIEMMGLKNVVLVGHDWGGAVSWMFAHRYSAGLKHLVVVNCTHPKTLMRGILRRMDKQHVRSSYIGVFQVPGLVENLGSVARGLFLKRGFLRMEGRPGGMDRELIDELVARFQTPEDLRGPLAYYRAHARNMVTRDGRDQLQASFAEPIKCPITMIWGDQDRILSLEVARLSDHDAHVPIDFRVLPGVGHFVSMETPDLLADEIAAVLAEAEPAEEVSEEDVSESESENDAAAP